MFDDRRHLSFSTEQLFSCVASKLRVVFFLPMVFVRSISQGSGLGPRFRNLPGSIVTAAALLVHHRTYGVQQYTDNDDTYSSSSSSVPNHGWLEWRVMVFLAQNTTGGDRLLLWQNRTSTAVLLI